MYFVATTLKIARLVYFRIQWENVQESQDFLWALYVSVDIKTLFSFPYCCTVMYIVVVNRFYAAASHALIMSNRRRQESIND